MKIKTLLVDDELSALDSLEILLSEFDTIEVVKKISNSIEVLPQIIKKEIDLLFIDIQMPKINGIEVVSSIRELNLNIVIIYVTAHPNFTHEAIKFNVFNYLLKPVVRTELADVVKKVSELVIGRQTHQIKENKILINHGNETCVIKVSDIAYIKAEGNYTYVYLNTGIEHMASYNIGKFITQLPNDLFFKVNRSTYVNKHLITSISRKNKICNFTFAHEIKTILASSVFLREFNNLYYNGD